MSSGPQTIEALLDDLGGCGPFQVMVTFCAMCIRAASTMSMIMMAFGNYNPGWRCLDNSTSHHWTNATADTHVSNDTDECHAYKTCSNVAFNPGFSTIVTEWELICDKAWIVSFTISLQMFGVLVGAYLTGYVGDTFGRKFTLSASAVYLTVVNVITMFSNSWQMFTAMRFLIGLGIPMMFYMCVIFALEFVHIRWRNVMACLPAWPIGCMIFALFAMATKDWRHLHLVNAGACLLTLFTYFWIPESLRWLIVKDRVDDAFTVVKNVARMNKKAEPSMAPLEAIAERYRKDEKGIHYSWFHLFRKDFRYPTLITAYIYVIIMMSYYSITFGVKSLSGDFSLNLILMFASEIPITLVSSTLPNYTGRRASVIIFLAISTLSLFTVVGLDLEASGSLKSTGILLNAMIARMTLDAACDILLTLVGEFYPTVFRSTSIGFAKMMSRCGAILAPYLIPEDRDSFYVYYLIMAVCMLIGCCLAAFLPETKDKRLNDLWELPVEKDGERDECLKSAEGGEEKTKV